MKKLTSLDGLISTVESLSDEQYRTAWEQHSCIGDHVRHVIEYCDSFLSGIESGTIDYDDRRRDDFWAQDRAAASRKLRTLQSALAEHADNTASIDVKEAVNAGEASPTAASTVQREYIFIAAHTVHHLAIIKLTATHLGVEVGFDIGKAASTITYEQENV